MLSFHIFAVKPIALTFLRLFCGGRAEKSALSLRIFIENAVVLGEASGVPCANFDPEAVGLLSNELCESPIWRAFARYSAAIKSVLCYISVVCL